MNVHRYYEILGQRSKLKSVCDLGSLIKARSSFLVTLSGTLAGGRSVTKRMSVLALSWRALSSRRSSPLSIS